MYRAWNQQVYIDGSLRDISDEVQKLENQLLDLPGEGHIVCALHCKSNLNFIISYFTLFISKKCIPLILKYTPSREELPLLEADYMITDSSGKIEIISTYRSTAHKYKQLQNCQVILQTSGSTGTPKHLSWSLAGIEYQSIATSKILEYTPNDCLGIIMPIFSAYSLSLIHIAFHHNIPISLSTSSEPRHFLNHVQRSKATTLDAHPDLYESILQYFIENPELKDAFSFIRAWNCGGDLLDQSLAVKWLNFMGQPLLDGYGLSEAGPNVAINGPNCYRIGTVGRVLEGTLLNLTDEGELMIKSPSIITYYLTGKNKIIDEQGWLYTGDLAQIDVDGYVTIIGRKEKIATNNP